MVNGAKAARLRGRPNDAHGDVTKRRCIDAAVRVFAEHGYTGAGMRTLAEAADVTAAALYNYFPSKAELYKAAWQAAQEQIFAAYAEAATGKSSLVEEIHAVLDTAAEFIRHRPALTRLALLATTDAGHPELGPLPVSTTVQEFLDGVVNRALARDEIRPDDQVQLRTYITLLIWGMSAMTAIDTSRLPRVLDTARWAAELRLDPRAVTAPEPGHGGTP